MGIAKILEGAKGIGKDLKWAGSKLFDKVEGEDIAKDGIGLYQKLAPYKLKGGVAATIAGGAIAMGVGESAIDSHNLAMMGGKIDAGDGLSGMTSTVAKSPLINKANRGEYNAEENMGGSLANAGADGDIVFALHNMR